MEVKEPNAKYLANDAPRVTEAGVLPADWSAVALSDLLSSKQLGGNYKNSSNETAWPLIKMGNLGRGRLNCENIEFIQSATAPAERDCLQFDDVLFNTRNTLDLVGKVAIWRNERPKAYFNSNIMRMRFDPQQVGSNAYMNYVLNTHRAVASFRAIATGTTSVAAIYSRDFSNVFLPIPSHLEEQRSIAKALTETDTLIDSLEQLLTKKRQIKQGAMQELLTGKRRLPGCDRPWTTQPFGSIASASRERVSPSLMATPPRCLELEHLQSGTGQLVGTGFESQQAATKSVFRQGDVLFGKLRAYLRKYWLAEFGGVCSTEIWVLRPTGELTSSKYLFYTVQRDDFIEAASSAYGTHMPRSDWKVVAEFYVRFPRDPAEQEAIAQVLSDMDTDIAALEARLTKARALKQAMAQALLSGRIRLMAPQA